MTAVAAKTGNLAPIEQRVLATIHRLDLRKPNGVVEDVEKLCVAVLEEQIRRKPSSAFYVDRAESLGFLLGEADTLAAKWDGRGTLIGFLFDRLRYALMEHWRKWRRFYGIGRNGQQDHIVSSLDAETGTVDDGDTGLAGLLGAHSDPAEDWLAAIGGLYATADRDVTGQDGLVDVSPGRGTPQAARRPGQLADGRDVVGSAGADRPAPFVDCRCGWRTYRQAPNGKPGWHIPDNCLNCGEELT